MALSLTAEQKSIFDIFSGKEQYIIPPYQRPYAWGYKHCRVLLDDLKNAYFHDKEEGYFLGNIVISQNQRDRNSLEVIDGQQRLTTLLLLIKALLHFDKDNYDLKNALDIQSSRRGEDTKPRLTSMVFMKEDNDFLKEALALDLRGDNCKLTKEDNLYKSNICYLYNEIIHLNKRIDIQDFIDFLMFDTYLLPIVTEGSDPDRARKKALKIFSTINDRGLNLSSADILKAKLYSLALNELQHSDFIKKWKEIEEGCIESNQTIDSIFKIYRLIVRSEEGLLDYFDNYDHTSNNDIVNFFIEKKYSPFNKDSYDKIMSNLLKAMESRKIVNDIRVNHYKYKKITTLIQILNISDTKIIDINIKRVIFMFIYKNGVNNEEKLTYFLEQLVKIVPHYIYYCFYKIVPSSKQANYSKEVLKYETEKYLIDMITIDIIKGISVEYSYILKINSPKYSLGDNHSYEYFLLLYFYLDKRNKSACNPYYTYLILYDEKDNIIEYLEKSDDKVIKDNYSYMKNKGGNNGNFFEIQRLYYDVSRTYRNIGNCFITDIPPRSKEDLKKSAVYETRESIKNILGKTDKEIGKETLKRTKKIHEVIQNFMKG